MKPSRSFTFLIALVLLTNFSALCQSLQKRSTTLMGGRFDITIVDRDSLSAQQNIDRVIAEISRIEMLISDWKPESQVSKVNQNAGIAPVKVDREVFELTQRAIELSKNTNGAFDISFAALDKVWKFDGSMTQMPSREEIAKSVSKIGYKNIILDSVNSTIFLRLRGMKIGFGALGEGYATDMSRKLMIKRGVAAGIINATGDMSTWGKQPNGKKWIIGVTNPFRTHKLIGTIELSDGAVTTSGSYEKFVIFDGKRYSHIINPTTGYPSTGLISVTIVGESAEIANSISTSIMVLGKQKGRKFLKTFPGYSGIMITDKGRIIKIGNKIRLKNRFF